MKKTFLTLAIIAIVQFSYAQFNTNSGNTTTSDNVGVGTTSPQSKLEVMGSGYAATKLITLSENEPARYNANIGITVSGGTQLNFGTRNDNVNFDNTLNLFNGNVGIGTTSPVSKLNVFSTASWDGITVQGGTSTDGVVGLQIKNSDATGNYSFGVYGSGLSGIGSSLYLYDNVNNAARFLINNNGNVGIGTTSPSSKLHVVSTSVGAETYPMMLENPGVSGTTASGLAFAGNGGAIKASIASAVYGDGYMIFRTNDNTEKMRITAGGNVLIGKTTQGNSTYKLDIDGKARANEIVVNSTGADFVFEPDYKLPKLSEVKSYIDQNHHLPQIPSAAEMQKNGMGVGELNTKLLQKVEELTLYLIEQKEAAEKQNKAQQEQINQLKEQLVSLSKIITKN